MQKKTKIITITGVSVIFALISLLLYIKNSGSGTLELSDGFTIQIQEQSSVVKASFRIFASEAELALPKKALSGENITGSTNYLYSSNCEQANWSSNGFSFQLLCKSGADIDADDLRFTKEEFKTSLNEAGYNCRNAGYEDYRSDGESLKYTLEFQESTEGSTRWYYYYNYVTLSGNAMYTLILQIDSPTDAEREILCSLLDNSNFETISLQEMEKNADNGDAKAQFYLGLHYYGGNDITQSNADTYLWVKKSAESGYRPAKLYLGYFIFNGIGTEANKADGLAIIEDLVNSGYEPAESWLTALNDLQKAETSAEN